MAKCKIVLADDHALIRQGLKKLIEENRSLEVELESETLTTEEIVVTAERTDENVKSAEMSTITVNPLELKYVPVIFGEQDILKSIQLLPGVSAGSEGSSGRPDIGTATRGRRDWRRRSTDRDQLALAESPFAVGELCWGKIVQEDGCQLQEAGLVGNSSDAAGCQY